MFAAESWRGDALCAIAIRATWGWGGVLALSTAVAQVWSRRLASALAAQEAAHFRASRSRTVAESRAAQRTMSKRAAGGAAASAIAEAEQVEEEEDEDEQYANARGLLRPRKKLAVPPDEHGAVQALNFVFENLVCALKYDVPLSAVLARDGFIYDADYWAEYLLSKPGTGPVPSPLTREEIARDVQPIKQIDTICEGIARRRVLEPERLTAWTERVDDQEGVAAMRQRAERGDKDACWGMSLLYKHGSCTVQPNAAEALEWLKVAARHNHPIALNNMGVAASHGKHGEDANAVQGAMLLSRAAEHGSDAACYNLGLYYRYGRWGFPVLEAETARWWSKIPSCSSTHITERARKCAAAWVHAYEAARASERAANEVRAEQ
jgi:TPR repeat protein